MQLAKAVASAAAALVLKAKNVAQKTEDAALQTQVIAAATQCALSTSQLVACTKVSDGSGLGWGWAGSRTFMAQPVAFSLPICQSGSPPQGAGQSLFSELGWEGGWCLSVEGGGGGNPHPCRALGLVKERRQAGWQAGTLAEFCSPCRWWLPPSARPCARSS